MQEFKQYILGELSIPYYLAAFFFCSLAILISLYAHSRKRDPASPRTPVVFSWRFLIWDNLVRIGVTIALMFLFFRFSPDIFGKPLSFPIAVGIGVFLSFGLDKAIQWLQTKFDILKMVK
jgi:hypothetical protein